jgi:hypothetical protein
MTWIQRLAAPVPPATLAGGGGEARRRAARERLGTLAGEEEARPWLHRPVIVGGRRRGFDAPAFATTERQRHRDPLTIHPAVARHR